MRRVSSAPVLIFGRVLGTAAVIAAVLSCTPVCAASEAERADLSRGVVEAVRVAERWIETGSPEKALALLRDAVRAARAAGIDTAAVRFMAAQALLKMRRYGAAAALLARLAEERPEVDRFQLDYAAALFALGRDDEAEAVFRDVRRRERLPPPVRRNVEDFLERIRARQRWRIDLDVGFWHDGNVNNAPERETVEVPLFGGLPITLSERPVSAWVVRTGARLRWREAVAKSGRVYLESRASLARNTAVGAGAHNRTWASLSTGPRAGYALEIAGRRRPGLIRADVGAEQRWRGGGGYAASLWTGLGVDQAITGDWRVGTSAQFWITRYDGENADVHPQGRSFGLHVARRLGPGWLTAGGTLSRETPQRRSLRWRSRAASLAYTADFGRDWNLSVRADLSRTAFDGEQPLFLTRRRDRTHGLALTVSHRALMWQGYLPEITLNWSRTVSTISLYDRELRIARVGVRRLF